MIQEFHFRKTSWGIFISIEANETYDISSSDIQIVDKVYLKVNWPDGKFKETIIFWFSKAIKEVTDQKKNTLDPYCINVINIVFNDCHFQEEGLYYVMLEWLAKKYDVKLPPINGYYDRETNRYIFPSFGEPDTIG